MAECLFCLAFGREERVHAAGDVTPSTKRHKAHTVKVFKSFRVDQYTQHHQREHPTKWAQYCRIRHDPNQSRTFFERRTLSGYLINCTSGVRYTIFHGVVACIDQVLCNDREEGWWREYSDVEPLKAQNIPGLVVTTVIKDGNPTQ